MKTFKIEVENIVIPRYQKAEFKEDKKTEQVYLDILMAEVNLKIDDNNINFMVSILEYTANYKYKYKYKFKKMNLAVHCDNKKDLSAITDRLTGKEEYLLFYSIRTKIINSIDIPFSIYIAEQIEETEALLLTIEKESKKYKGNIYSPSFMVSLEHIRYIKNELATLNRQHNALVFNNLDS